MSKLYSKLINILMKIVSPKTSPKSLDVINLLKTNEEMLDQTPPTKSHQDFYNLMTDFKPETFNYLYRLKFHKKVKLLGLSSSQLKGYERGSFFLFTKRKPMFYIIEEYTPLEWYKKEYTDACISYPTIRSKKNFPKKCKLKYKTIDGKLVEQIFKGKECMIVHHEVQHAFNDPQGNLNVFN